MTNSYGVLVEAARSLVQVEILGQIDDPNDEQQRTFLEANRAVMLAVRDALAQRCFVPLEFSQDYWERHQPEICAFRDLARSFKLQALAAERAGRLGDAVDAGLVMLNLANAIRQNGLVVDTLVGSAIAGIGLERLRCLRHGLPPEASVRLAAVLLAWEAAREPFDDIYARDKEWERQVPQPNEPITAESMPPIEGIDPEVEEMARNLIVGMMQSISNLPPDEYREYQRKTDLRAPTLSRLLALDCALNAFRATHGAFPARLADVAPEFIAAVPSDLYANAPFRYRNLGASFLLYSDGPNGGNDEERFGSWQEVQWGDPNLCLDTDDYPPGCPWAPPRERWPSRWLKKFRSLFRKVALPPHLKAIDV